MNGLKVLPPHPVPNTSCCWNCSFISQNSCKILLIFMTKTINLHAILSHTKYFHCICFCLPMLRMDLRYLGKISNLGIWHQSFMNVVGRSLFSQHGVVFICHTPPCVSLGGGLEFTLPQGAPGQQWDPGLHWIRWGASQRGWAGKPEGGCGLALGGEADLTIGSKSWQQWQTWEMETRVES